MEKIIFENVGKRLKLAREKNKITLEAAGNKVDVHKSTILRWENGETEKIKLPMLQILAEYYNVNPVWLMGYDVPMELNANDISNSTSENTTLNIEGLDEHDIKALNVLAELLKQKKENK